MALASLLEDGDLVEIEPQNKWKVIDTLVDLLFRREKLPADKKDHIASLIREREESMSTGIGDGVAIPHCSSPHTDKACLVMAVVRDGMDFEAIDGQPVHFVILLVVPKNEFQTHISTLAEIAKLMNNSDFRSELLACTTLEDMVSLIRSKG